LEPVSPGTSEHELLQRLQRGENAAWQELVRVYSPRLYSFLRHNLPSADDAEDVLSETLAAAVRALRTFDGQAALSTFLYSLAYRKMADFWRRNQKTTELLEHVAAPEPYGERVEFEEVLDGLPELTRTVLLLRYQVGLSVPEIATIIERSYKGTESLLSRGRFRQ
jgi:RNA polymerase sigma-70 factor (ECF subfamily)